MSAELDQFEDKERMDQRYQLPISEAAWLTYNDGRAQRSAHCQPLWTKTLDDDESDFMCLLLHLHWLK